jgi:hypothetical protein
MFPSDWTQAADAKSEYEKALKLFEEQQFGPSDQKS